MPMTSIILLLDASSSTQTRLEFALRCAACHGASLTALFLPGVSGFESDSNASRTWETRFRTRAEASSVCSNWISLVETQNPWEQLYNLVHAASLIITGQTSGDGYDGELPQDLTERLVLGSGRPVLSVPYAGECTQCAQRVLVAWNNGRESTRALHDAMPLLQKAQRVHLITLITQESEISDADDRLAWMIQYLKNAGVHAKGDLVLSLDFPPGDMLLNHACEESSDLLVMGAFRSDKPVLGKIARHVLQHMTLPVLMSH